MKNIVFDLDGTLTDPLEGIANCIRHSLEQLQIACPPNSELAGFIGPPLRSTFSTICNSTDNEFIEYAVRLFRDRFSTIGLFENTVYDGVREMLGGLCELGG